MIDDLVGSLAPLSGPRDPNDPATRAAEQFYTAFREQQRYEEVTAATVEETKRREKLITELELANVQKRLELSEAEALTEEQKRQKFCFDAWQRGRTLKEINADLKHHPTWEHFKDERSVRRLITAWGKRIGVKPRTGQPGRPKSRSK